MIQQVLNGLFGEGGLLRVRGVMALTLTGGATYLAIDGVLPINVYVTVWTALVSVYTGARIAKGP